MVVLLHAVSHDLEEFSRVCRLYNFVRPKLSDKFTGFYFLVHTPSLLSAIGDPSLDMMDGSRDAWKRFKKHHGTLYGQYFGMRIGENEARKLGD